MRVSRSSETVIEHVSRLAANREGSRVFSDVVV